MNKKTNGKYVMTKATSYDQYYWRNFFNIVRKIYAYTFCLEE